MWYRRRSFHWHVSLASGLLLILRSEGELWASKKVGLVGAHLGTDPVSFSCIYVHVSQFSGVSIQRQTWLSVLSLFLCQESIKVPKFSRISLVKPWYVLQRFHKGVWTQLDIIYYDPQRAHLQCARNNQDIFHAEASWQGKSQTLQTWARMIDASKDHLLLHGGKEMQNSLPISLACV